MNGPGVFDELSVRCRLDCYKLLFIIRSRSFVMQCRENFLLFPCWTGRISEWPTPATGYPITLCQDKRGNNAIWIDIYPILMRASDRWPLLGTKFVWLERGARACGSAPAGRA